MAAAGDAPPGTRRVRLERRRRRRDRRALQATIVVAVLAGVVAALVGTPRGGPSAAAGSDRSVGDGPEAASADAAPQVRALGHVGPDGRLDVLLVAGVDGEGRASVVLVPSLTLVEVPSLGSQTLADLTTMGDAALVETTLENALGVGLDGILLVDDAGLAELLAPAQEMTVDLPRPVRVDDEAGTIAFRRGSTTITSAEAMRLLAAPHDDGELEHLVTVGAVVDGWREALGDPDVAWATLAVDPGAAVVTGLASSDVRYTTLPVDRVGAGGEDRFAPRRDEVRALVADAYPWALLGPPAPRPRVEILNGTGAVGVTREVAREVVPTGVEVTLTGNVPGFGASETVVVYYRDDAAPVAHRLAEALGVGRVAKGDQPLGVVDVTVVVGADFPVTPS